MKNSPLTDFPLRFFCFRCRRSPGPTRGFSLVELLGVLAILSLLATLVTPAVTSLVAGNSTARGADALLSAAGVARQTAMTRNVPVAFVVSRLSGGSGNPQAVLLLESRNAQWSGVGSWTRLPANVEVGVHSRSGAPSFFASSTGVALTGELPVKLGGRAVSEYDYIIFHPDGSVDAAASGPALTLGRGSRPGVSEYVVVVQSDSGRVKVITP